MIINTLILQPIFIIILYYFFPILLLVNIPSVNKKINVSNQKYIKIINEYIFEPFTFINKKNYSSKVIYVYCPHNIIPYPILFDYQSTIMISNTVLLNPFIKIYALLRGSIIDASKENILNHIRFEKNNVAICVGGIREMITQKLYTKHYGLFQISYNENIPIVPVVIHNNDKFINIIPSQFALSFYLITGIPLMWIISNPFSKTKVVVEYCDEINPRNFTNHIDYHHHFYKIVNQKLYN